jgi:hypothetical protein
MRNMAMSVALTHRTPRIYAAMSQLSGLKAYVEEVAIVRCHYLHLNVGASASDTASIL